jgi:DNA-binding IclR family transcriptional regulator
VAFPAGAPVAALSVAAISVRLDEQRRAEVGALLRQQAQRLAGQLTSALAGRG